MYCIINYFSAVFVLLLCRLEYKHIYVLLFTFSKLGKNFYIYQCQYEEKVVTNREKSFAPNKGVQLDQGLFYSEQH